MQQMCSGSILKLSRVPLNIYKVTYELIKLIRICLWVKLSLHFSPLFCLDRIDVGFGNAKL